MATPFTVTKSASKFKPSACAVTFPSVDGGVGYLAFALGCVCSQSVALIWLAMSFIGLLMLQKRLISWSSLSKEYQQMRAKITSVVFVCHLFMFAQLNHSGVVL